MRHTLKRSEIIKGKKLFAFIHNHNIRVDGTFLKCYVARIPPQPPDKKKLLFGIKVQRNIKRAVDRNRIKRLVRESFRAEKEKLFSSLQHLPGSIALVFVYPSKASRSSTIRPQKDFQCDVKKISEEIFNRLVNN